MATATRICKVCGCEYEYCHTARRVAGVFRWQDVACSPEHGNEYLARIIASRSGNVAETTKEAKSDVSTTDMDSADEYENDELFEEDFDDDAEEPVIVTK